MTDETLEIQRWTAKRKTAVVLEVFGGWRERLETEST
jgi:hypothetical protein